eukprot:m.118563 g.118563  ORF g.118563 m.118563 type:complete len:440 (+) comp13245_c0_seq2:104-1423(+)
MRPSASSEGFGVDSDDDHFVVQARAPPRKRTSRKRGGTRASESESSALSRDKSPSNESTPPASVRPKRKGKEPQASRPVKSPRAAGHSMEVSNSVETLKDSQVTVGNSVELQEADMAIDSADEIGESSSPVIVSRRKRTKKQITAKSSDMSLGLSADNRANAQADASQTLPPENLRQLEECLRCEICQDLFSIPMIIPACSHTFCSECIRRCLSYSDQKLRYNPKCPSCGTHADESSLRYNRAIDEVVYRFLQVRDRLASISKGPANGRKGAQSRPAPLGGFVHFEKKCDSREMPVGTTVAGGASLTLSPSRQRLAKVAFSTMNPRQLKQLLESNHLPSHGDKKAMGQRYHNLVHLYNSECDAKNPRTLQQCASEVVRREKVAEHSRRIVSTQAPSFDSKDPDLVRRRKVDYLRRNNAKFKALIAQAKATRKKSTKPTQ